MKSVYLAIFAAVLIAHPATVFAKMLNDPELVFESLAHTFKGVVEHSGGLSTSIDLKDLSCVSSNSRVGTKPVVKTSCTATKLDNTILKSDESANDLILGLINAGLDVDRTAEPGSAYVHATNLECMRMECKSSDPEGCKKPQVTYVCNVD